MKEINLSTKNWRKQIETFVVENEIKDVFLFDKITCNGTDIKCNTEVDLLKAIDMIVNLEHSIPYFIGINPLTNDCCLLMEFTKGNIKLNSIYTFKNNILQLLYDLEGE